jgi:predicted ATPase
LRGVGRESNRLAAHQATGTELLRPHFLGLLAEALHIAGQDKEALLILDDALALADRNSERYYEAELYRLKGELLLMGAAGRALFKTAVVGQEAAERHQPATINAEECLHQSMKIAQRQKARALELRAATSLARHYQNQARPEEARVLLTRIYSTFTEGFDTSDMREAKTLLYALS